MTPRVYLDTNIFIATFESTSHQVANGWSVFQAFESGRARAVTSELTLAELLSKPIEKGDVELVQTYEALLKTGSSLDVLPIGRDVLVAAAGLRAQDRSLKLPDAIHVATATLAHCSIFMTGDLRLNLPPSLRRVRLDADAVQAIEGSST